MNSYEHEQTDKKAQFRVLGQTLDASNFKFSFEGEPFTIGPTLGLLRKSLTQYSFSYGQILALSGDYRKYFHEFEGQGFELEVITGSAGYKGDNHFSLDWVLHNVPFSIEVPGYLSLAACNPEHFRGPPQINADTTYAVDPNSDDSVRTYNQGHSYAVSSRLHMAPSMDERYAYAINAFYDHFLTDMFSSGHMRVPRRSLHSDWGITDLHTAKLMHDEDGEYGLYVTNQRGVAWKAFGDGFQVPNAMNQDNWNHALEAVATSVDDVTTGHDMLYEALSIKPEPFPPGAGWNEHVKTDSQISDYAVEIKPKNSTNRNFRCWISNFPDDKRALVVPEYLGDRIKGALKSVDKIGSFSSSHIKTISRDEYWIKTTLRPGVRRSGYPLGVQTYPMYIIAKGVLYVREGPSLTTGTDGSDVLYVTAEYNASRPDVSDGSQTPSLTERLSGHQQGWPPP